MNRYRTVIAVLTLAMMLSACAAITAEEHARQPVMLPMVELLKQLGDGKDYVLLPLAKYRELIGNGKRDPAVPPASAMEPVRVVRTEHRLASTRIGRERHSRTLDHHGY